ncbi:MAG: DUF4260 family protein [Chitinophagaceae bacterium]|nr:MAG: DUF4260 family protein [Chitinophagaceae bacterium]
MKSILKLEEAAMFLLCVFVLVVLEAHRWVYLLLVLGPDISMIGYLGGKKFGAACYNSFHHKGIAVLIFAVGVVISDYQGEILNIIGIILFGHSSMDRMFGYGLKYSQGFKFTHLGEIGKK